MGKTRGMSKIPNDPREKNIWFETSSIGQYLNGYRTALYDVLGQVNTDSLEQAFSAIEKTANSKGHVYAIGNGGSSAIADHLCCDWTKGTHVDQIPTIRTHSLSANGALFTAVANDFGHDNSFSQQVEFYGEKGDLLIAISSSGNSENIIRAVHQAKKLGIPTIGLSGFDGGRLKTEADISLHIAIKNYGLVEDAHQILMHVIAQYIVSRRLKL
jgi:phosphoheptose isomerase